MSAYKKLNRQDVYVTSYTAKKDQEVTAGTTPGAFSAGFSSGFDIYILEGISSVTLNLFGLTERGNTSTELITYGTTDYYHKSVQQLYYSNFTQSVVTGSFENFLQSSFETGSRELGTSGSLMSIGRGYTGNYIVPSTVNFSISSGSISGSITDDGEGKLYITGSNSGIDGQVVGDVIYPHGNLILTNNTAGSLLLNYTGLSGVWQSSQTIFEANYHCKVRDYEFNYTYNPSAQISGSNGKLANNVTGSYFTPYITAIGLYNDADELIAVAKLGQPVPKSPDTEMTFQIKLDF